MFGIGKQDPYRFARHRVNMPVSPPRIIPLLLPLALAEKISAHDRDQTTNHKGAKGRPHEGDYSAAAGPPHKQPRGCRSRQPLACEPRDLPRPEWSKKGESP